MQRAVAQATQVGRLPDYGGRQQLGRGRVSAACDGLPHERVSLKSKGRRMETGP